MKKTNFYTSVIELTVSSILTVQLNLKFRTLCSNRLNNNNFYFRFSLEFLEYYINDSFIGFNFSI